MVVWQKVHIAYKQSCCNNPFSSGIGWIRSYSQKVCWLKKSRLLWLMKYEARKYLAVSTFCMFIAMMW